jgi:hypothetical protein
MRHGGPSARRTGRSCGIGRDGSLWLIRDQWQAETAWAPKHVGRELGYVRARAEDAGCG